ncbi:MAG: cadmium carbonic anhydrase [Magnetococcales bacterium]|nr:cadmium carbonic anhydrase [Magnetococcales bacterium]
MGISLKKTPFQWAPTPFSHKFQTEKAKIVKSKKINISALLSILAYLPTAGLAGEKHQDDQPASVTPVACTGYGPQTPRDIDQKTGKNRRSFSLAPHFTALNLCNIHFHVNAEHKAKDFSIFAGAGDHGHGGGYQCVASKSLTPSELTPLQNNNCAGVQAGDTIEVHWVHSSCDITPGKGLGSCLSQSCANPNLRVETQVFTVVNDASALNFNDMNYDGHKANGLHQAKSIPDNTGAPVEFLGSTTGPAYSEQSCSPMQVSWSVRPNCAKLDINSLSQWCAKNAFMEDHAHGVRQLVVNPDLLSKID